MEIFGLSLQVLPLVMLVVFGASLAKGVTGFGFGLLASPFLVLVMDAKLVVAIGIPIQLVIDLLILVRVWGHLDLRKVVPLLVAGAAGVPLGTLIIVAVSSETLRLIVLSVVVISGFIMLVGYTVYIAKERLAGALTGFVTGTLYSSTGIAGPPMAMFMVNQRWERGTFRSSLSAVNVSLEALTLVSFGASGVIGINSLGIDLLLLPVVLLSSYLATKLVARLTTNQFRKTIVYMVLITGVVALMVHFFL